MDEIKKLELGVFLMESSAKFKKLVDSRNGRFAPDEIEVLRDYGELFIETAINAKFINKLESGIEDLEKIKKRFSKVES